MEAAALPRPARITSPSLSIPAAVLRLRSDEQLVALFRAGSDEAFSVIHDRYRPRLLAYSRQMLGGSQADAEDVLQDVFVRAHAALRSSQTPITLRAWLYRIAHNRCVDGLRRPGPLPSEISPGAQPALSRGAQHDPPVEAERSEDLQRLVRDLLALPEQQRSALLMRELQGLSYDELACSLGVSVGAVKSLLVRARGGVLSAAVARDAPCTEICLELTAAHDRGVRPSGQARRHLRECAGCRAHRIELRKSSRQLAALAPPAGLLGQLGLIGGGGTGGGFAAAGGGGLLSGGGAAACGVAAVGKVAALVCAVALVGGAGDALTTTHHPAAPLPARSAEAPHPAVVAAAVHHQRRTAVHSPAVLPSPATPVAVGTAPAVCPVEAVAQAPALAAAATVAVATAVAADGQSTSAGPPAGDSSTTSSPAAATPATAGASSPPPASGPTQGPSSPEAAACPPPAAPAGATQTAPAAGLPAPVNPTGSAENPVAAPASSPTAPIAQTTATAPSPGVPAAISASPAAAIPPDGAAPASVTGGTPAPS